MRKILPSITTTRNSNWQARIKEINKLGLKEIALFPTCLDKKSREKIYPLLEKAGVKQLPLVHIRSDMAPDELDFLIKKFQTRVFNLHTHREYSHPKHFSKYRKMILIENVYQPLDAKEIKKFSGICLDISHLENDRLMNPEKFQHNLKVLEKYPIGCNHISCLQKVLRRDLAGYWRYDSHFLKRLSQLDYLKNYPQKYFSSLITIELENTIEKQLKIRDYLIKKNLI